MHRTARVIHVIFDSQTAEIESVVNIPKTTLGIYIVSGGACLVRNAWYEFSDNNEIRN